MLTPGSSYHAPTRRSGLPYGNGRRTTPFRTAKIAVTAAMPMTRVRTATVVKTGVRRSERQANRIMVSLSFASGNARSLVAALRAMTALSLRAEQGICSYRRQAFMRSFTGLLRTHADAGPSCRRQLNASHPCAGHTRALFVETSRAVAAPVLSLASRVDRRDGYAEHRHGQRMESGPA
jgi:hypothetical protein